MDMKILLVCLVSALLAGFVHGSLGMGFGMIAMATVPLFMPYNNAAAIVSVALLVLVVQVCILLREDIDWQNVLIPAAVLATGKILGIVLMMHLQSSALHFALGGFLILYSVSQLLNLKALQIRGTLPEAVLTCGLGGLFGGVFNVSGPLASIYCQAKYGDSPRAYAANMNAIFAPAGVIAVVMHLCYGNFSPECIVGSIIMVAGVIFATILGVAVLKRLDAAKMRFLSYIYIIIMGTVICVSG